MVELPLYGRAFAMRGGFLNGELVGELAMVNRSRFGMTDGCLDP